MKKSIRALWSIAIDHFTVSLKANLVSIGTNENDHLILLPPEQEYNPRYHLDSTIALLSVLGG